MTLATKFFIIAIALVVVDYATGGFVFQQVGKVDVSQQVAPVECAIGAYMFSPSWNGIPMPATDDLLAALILGFVVLGIFSALNKPLTNKQKFGVFFLMWIGYKIVGYLLMTQYEGCEAYYNQMELALSPFAPLFFIFAIYAVWRVWISRRK